MPDTGLCETVQAPVQVSGPIFGGLVGDSAGPRAPAYLAAWGSVASTLSLLFLLPGVVLGLNFGMCIFGGLPGCISASSTSCCQLACVQWHGCHHSLGVVPCQGQHSRSTSEVCRIIVHSQTSKLFRAENCTQLEKFCLIHRCCCQGESS